MSYGGVFFSRDVFFCAGFGTFTLFSNGVVIFAFGFRPVV